MVGKILAAPSVELGNKWTVWELEAKKLIKMNFKVLIESLAGFLMDSPERLDNEALNDLFPFLFFDQLLLRPPRPRSAQNLPEMSQAPP